MLKNSKIVYFCHLKKLVRQETFGPYYVQCGQNVHLLNVKLLVHHVTGRL